MARELDHVALANRNHDALIYLVEAPDRFPEWITTAAFYKAVQVIEASFAHLRVGTTTSHVERRRKLKGDERFRLVYAHYRPLWSASSVARYLVDQDRQAYRRFGDYLPARAVVADLVERRMRSIESIVRSHAMISEHARAELCVLA